MASNEHSDDERMEVPPNLNPVEGEQQQDIGQDQIADGNQQRDAGFRVVHHSDRLLDDLDRDRQPDPDKHRIHPRDRDMLPADLEARDRHQRQVDIDLGRVPNAARDRHQPHVDIDLGRVPNAARDRHQPQVDIDLRRAPIADRERQARRRGNVNVAATNQPQEVPIANKISDKLWSTFMYVGGLLIIVLAFLLYRAFFAE